MRTYLIAFLCLLSTTVHAWGGPEYTTQVLADDANGIAEDQTAGGAGNLTLDGALGGSLPEAQIIAIESTGNLSGVTFTITGRDADFREITEDVTGPNNATVKSTKYFKTVTQIAVDGAVGTNVEVGTLRADGAVTPTFVFDPRQTPFNVTIGAELTAGSGITFGAQYTLDKPPTGSQPFTDAASWNDAVDSSGSGLDPDSNTATGDVNVYSPVKAARGKITAGSSDGTVTYRYLQGAIY